MEKNYPTLKPGSGGRYGQTVDKLYEEEKYQFIEYGLTRDDIFKIGIPDFDKIPYPGKKSGWWAGEVNEAGISYRTAIVQDFYRKYSKKKLETIPEPEPKPEEKTEPEPKPEVKTEPEPKPEVKTEPEPKPPQATQKKKKKANKPKPEEVKTGETVPEAVVTKGKFTAEELQILPSLILSGLLPVLTPKIDKVDLQVVFGPTLMMLGLTGPKQVIPLDKVQPVSEDKFVKNTERIQKKQGVRSRSSLDSAYKTLAYSNFTKRTDKFVIRVNNFFRNYQENSLKYIEWKKKNTADVEDSTKDRSLELKKIFERTEKEKGKKSKKKKQKTSGIDIDTGGLLEPLVLGAASAASSAISGGGGRRGGEQAPPPPEDIKAEFTPRSYPINSAYHAPDRPTHAGVDLGTPKGTYIAIRAKSKVILAEYNRDPTGYGTVVAVWVPQISKQFVFGHLSEISSTTVNGAEIPAGKIIGKTGGRRGEYGSGDSSKDHLHFEVHPHQDYRGSPGAQDPTSYISWLLLGGTTGTSKGIGGSNIFDQIYGVNNKKERKGEEKIKVINSVYKIDDGIINANVKFAVNKLRKSGILNDYEVAGWIGNMLHESPGLYPNRYQGDFSIPPKATKPIPGEGDGRGLAQWGYDPPTGPKGGDGGRWNKALKWWEKRKEKVDLFHSLDGQLDWALYEATKDSYYRTQVHKKTAKSVNEATIDFLKGFEGAGAPHPEERIKNANEVYKYILSIDRKLKTEKYKQTVMQSTEELQKIKKIDSLLETKASGGIGTSQKILVGEAGPEFVIPMSKIKVFMKLMTDKKVEMLSQQMKVQPPTQTITTKKNKIDKLNNNFVSYNYTLFEEQDDVTYYYKPTIYY